MKRLYCVSVIVLICHLCYAQAPASWSSADMYLAIRKLNVLGSVLYVAAHPDDENTRLITYFSKERMYRTGYLSMTRGDGGQNLIGEEQGIELGLIRTQELLSARRIDDGEQFFTRAFDFGYSKTPQETFGKWNKEKVLSDVVWVIRKFQPDVIITRFPTTGEGGHGHHTASAILALEAFDAAADASRFPEQLRFVKPWKAERILWNSFNFGNTNLTREDQFKFDVGTYNPLLGKSYGEIAAESRSQHKSQGFGVPRSRGEALEYFSPLAGSGIQSDIFENVETSWKRVPRAEKIPAAVDALARSFDLLHPERSVKELVKLYNLINLLDEGYWKSQKLKEVQQLIEQCSGLWMDVFSASQFAVQSDSVRFNFQFNNRMGNDVVLKRIAIDEFDTSFNQRLEKNRNLNFAKNFFVPANKPVTQPYWLEQPMSEGHFNVSDQRLIGEPDIQPAYKVSIVMNIEGQDFDFTRTVKNKFTDPVRGEVYWPLTVIPAYTLKLMPELVIGTKQESVDTMERYEKRYTSHKSRNMIVAESRPDRKELKPVRDSFFLDKGEVKTLPVERNIKMEGQFSEQFIAGNSGEELKDMFTIRYDHIPAITYFRPARVETRILDLAIAGRNIGYIPGAGDKVPEALEQMGYEVTLLGDRELMRNNLSVYDAIITGIRAYNTSAWLNNHHEKLMRYVENGGNLIVQYNTSTNIGPIRARIGPYSFGIARTRVSDENAPVSFLKPDHQVLNFPNKITQDDFKGWVQERSIYHAADSSGKFEKILSMADPDERQDDGSLVIAKYGKGYFTYTGIVFFRQLPAGVPGAYRLLANIIALNRKKAF